MAKHKKWSTEQMESIRLAVVSGITYPQIMERFKCNPRVIKQAMGEPFKEAAKEAIPVVAASATALPTPIRAKRKPPRPHPGGQLPALISAILAAYPQARSLTIDVEHKRATVDLVRTEEIAL